MESMKQIVTQEMDITIMDIAQMKRKNVEKRCIIFIFAEKGERHFKHKVI